MGKRMCRFRLCRTAASTHILAAAVFVAGSRLCAQAPNQGIIRSPTVTINQAAGQPDPSGNLTVNFTAIFSTPVTGFTGNSVLITGTAPGTKTVTVTGGPAIYNVAVSGISAPQFFGTVIASIPAGAVEDAAGTPSAASTSTDNTVTIASSQRMIAATSTSGIPGSTVSVPVVFTASPGLKTFLVPLMVWASVRATSGAPLPASPLGFQAAPGIPAPDRVANPPDQPYGVTGVEAFWISWTGFYVIGTNVLGYVQVEIPDSAKLGDSYAVSASGMCYATGIFVCGGGYQISLGEDATVTVGPNPIAPAIASLSSPNTNNGGSTFSLAVNGSGFVPSSVVQWNGSNRKTQFVNSTLVEADILASDIAAPTVGQITVVNPDPFGGASNDVPFDVLPSPPQPSGGAVTVTPNALSFTAQTGWPCPSQTMAISSSGQWGIGLASSAGHEWIRLSPANGNGPATVTVSVTDSSLPEGTYHTTLVVSSLSGSTQYIPVSLTVKTEPDIILSSSSASFEGTTGSDIADQVLNISSNGQAVDWAATVSTQSGGDWLGLSATTGRTLSTPKIEVNTAGLAAGTYQGSIVFATPNAGNTPQTVSVKLILEAPVITLTPASLVFTDTNSPSQTVQVQNTGNGDLPWTAAVATASGSNWLSVTPHNGAGPSSFTVAVNPDGLAAGDYTGSVTVSAAEGTTASPAVLSVKLTVPGPRIQQGGVVEAATFSPDGVSSGAIASLFGENLSRTTVVAQPSAGPTGGVALPRVLDGVQVLVNGTAAPLFYVSPTQINFQVPAEISASNVPIIVVSDGTQSMATSVNILPVAPRIFTFSSGQAAVLNEDSSLNSSQNPAAAGSVVSIFATGLGPTDPPIITGQLAGTSPLSVTVDSPVVLVGGVPADLLYSGLAPGFAGVYQLNIRMPAAPSPDTALTLAIQLGNASSNTVVVAVR